ncbi:EAL and HDOD domain-containing protein [Paraburkholderia aspalathi]|uniref:EAL and modified HD-GYP domain-containing signal transduction protein n=1 Tax=Paraburkholderia aspalathi TaxID=1324617 RepID=A0A1I7EJM5_9BURK|nr:EAL domain-containing protein [Paraburkholderia aspalathi]SFU24104.1 EAL and modified HD-GYP domain-containing signal transduction protein [Paraburkholderia aspalathi]
MSSDSIEAIAPGDADVFVARQPVMDRAGRMVGYELLFRDGRTSGARIGDELRCTTAVIERAVGSIGIERLAGTKACFLNCPHDFLFSGYPYVLPASRFVLEILESVELTSSLSRRCSELQGAGFQIALDDVTSMTDEIQWFLPYVDIVKIDWPFVERAKLPELISQFKRAGKVVLAEKIESAEDAELAWQLGCDLLQGYYFARPQTLSDKRAMPPVRAILRVFDLVGSGAALDRVARALGETPLLVAQLLRLANCSEQPNGKSERISSLRQALSIAGSHRLLHWCGLLLYVDRDRLPFEDDPVVLLAQRRAHFMEEAIDAMPDGSYLLAAAAYLTGMLSLLHVAYHMELRSFVDELPVFDSIRVAILNGGGILGELLSVAALLEQGDVGAAGVRLRQPGVSPARGRKIVECY